MNFTDAEHVRKYIFCISVRFSCCIIAAIKLFVGVHAQSVHKDVLWLIRPSLTFIYMIDIMVCMLSSILSTLGCFDSSCKISQVFFLTLQGCSSTCMFLGQSGVLLVQPTGFSYYLQWVFCGKISSKSQSGKFLKIWHFPFPGAHRSIETVVFDSNSHDHLNEVCISCSHNFRAFRSYRNLL